MERIPQLVREMSRLSWLGGVLDTTLAGQLALGPTDLECLALLRDSGPMAAGELAEVMGLTTGAITGVVDRLEKAGWVSRQSDPADRRRVIVQPVPERLEELNRLHDPLVQAANQALFDYSEPQLDLLLDFHRRAYRVVQQEIPRLRAREAQPRSGAHNFAAPLGEATAGRLEFANGASRVSIHAGHGPAELYRAYVQGLDPDVQVRDGVVTIRYRRVGVFDWSRHAADVSLNPDVPWAIALHGGASKVTLDGRGLRLTEVCVAGGASELTILLSRPRGTIPVQIEGGVSRAQIARPAGVPVELRIRGGASRLALDEQRFGAIGGEARLASPGYELAADRYQIEIGAGASRLEVIAASPERLAYWPGLPGMEIDPKSEVR